MISEGPGGLSHKIARRVPLYSIAMPSALSGWCAPVAAARSGSCGWSPRSRSAHRYGSPKCMRRTCTEPIYRNPPAVISCGEGSFCVFGEMDRGDRVVEGQKVVLWGSFS